MQTRFTLAALVLAAGFAGQAFADTDQITVAPFVGSLSRAEVQADLATTPRVDTWNEGYNRSEPFRSTATRADLTADYIAARDEVRALTGEVGQLVQAPALRAEGSRTVAGQPLSAH